MVLPLVDISSVKEVEGGPVGFLLHCFKISCPPVHITVQVEIAPR